MAFGPERLKRPPLDVNSLDSLHVDSASRAAVASDFGKIVRREPQGVLRPRGMADVAAAFRYCRSHDIEIAIRGQGHSTNGQALTTGLVIDSSTLNRVHSVTPTQIVVEAGARWRDVLAATLPLGVTPPVLTDYLGLSVGGTLSVGGLGGTSFVHGSQADCVVALDAVLPNGEVVHCSRTSNPELFEIILCGLGQCAFIAQATLRLMAAPTKVRRFKLLYRHLQDLHADQCRLLHKGRFDYLEGQIVWEESRGWSYVLEAAKFLGSPDHTEVGPLNSDLSFDPAATEITELTYLEFLERLEPSLARFKLSGEWDHAHPWLNVFLPGSEVLAFTQGILDTLQPEDIGPSGLILVYPLRKERFRRPLMRLPEEDVVFLLALLRTVPPGSEAVHRTMLDNRDIVREARSIGGTIYPVGAVELTFDDWKAQFGSQWDVLNGAKGRYDPKRLLADGHGIFASPGSRQHG